MLLVLLLALTCTVIAQNCGVGTLSVCTVDHDCIYCANSTTVTHVHTLFVGVQSIVYKCVTGHCALDTSTVSPSLTTVCTLSSSGCCVPSGDLPTDVATCQSKHCRQALACDPRGFCTYDESVFEYTGCCRQPSDCPAPSAMGFNVTTIACSVAQCVGGGACVYTYRPNCCLTNADCSQFTKFAYTGVCDQDPSLPGQKTCRPAITQTGVCTNNQQCSATSPCEKTSCNLVTNRCVTMPAPLFANGCCLNGSDSSACNLGNTCTQVVAPFCQNVTKNWGGGVVELPTFKCIYNDQQPSGCCQNANTNVCTKLSLQSPCITTTCGLVQQKCLLSTTIVDTTCCYSPDNCSPFPSALGIIEADNLCLYATCSGPANPPTVLASNAFTCQQHTISPCNPASPPAQTASGLTPALSILAPTFSCNWACGVSDPNQNVIRSKFSFTNPGPGLLYGFNVKVVVTNTVAASVVLSITIDGNLVSSDPSRIVPVGLFVANAPASVPGSFSVLFVMQQFFPIYPGESASITFKVPFVGNLAVTQHKFQFVTNPFEPCTPFYNGAPGCNSLNENNNPPVRIARATQGTPVVIATPCSSQCLAPTPAPTPHPVTSSPTPPPSIISIPLDLLTGVDRIYTVTPISCKWTCNETETGPNRIKLRVTETSLVSYSLKSAMIYTFTFTVRDSLSNIIPLASLLPIGLSGPPFVVVEPTDPLYHVDAINGALSFNPITEKLTLNVAFSSTIDPFSELAFNLTFFFSGTVSSVTLGRINIAFTATAPPQTCTTQLVLLGLCTNGQLGNSISFLQSLTVPPIFFGNAADECSPNTCPTRIGTINLNVGLHRTIPNYSCDWRCSDGNITEHNLYRFNVCYTNTNPLADSFAQFISSDGFRFTTFDTFPNGSQSPSQSPVSPVAFNYQSMILQADDLPAIIPPFGIPVLGDPGWEVVFDPPVPILPGTTECFSLKFYRNPLVVLRWPFTINLRIVGGVMCTILEVESGQCAPVPPFTLITRLVDAAVEGIGKPVLFGGGFGAFEFNACSPLCTPGTLVHGNIGGRAFFDTNANGELDSGEPFIGGIIVNVIDSNDNTVVTLAKTDANGYYIFNGTTVFSKAPIVFFQISPPSVPVGSVITKIGILNPFFANQFAGSTPRTLDFDQFTTNPFRLAGFISKSQAAANCVRNTTGPFVNNTVLITATGTNCTDCVSNAFNPGEGLACTVYECGPAAIQRVAYFNFSISNFNTTTQPAAYIRIEFGQTKDNLDASQLVCADASVVYAPNGTYVLGSGDAMLGGKKAHNAYVEVGWTTLPVGANVYTFTVRINYCASVEPFRFNVTATIENDACVKLLEGWSSCSTDGANADFRQCYNEQVFNASQEVCTVCPPLPPPPTGPPTPAPPVTFGPPGASSPIATSIMFIEEDAACVTTALIDKQRCRDKHEGQENCAAAGALKSIVVANYSFALKHGASNESATATLTLRRNMPRSSLYCDSFDPELNVSVTSHGVRLHDVVIILTSSVNQQKQKMQVKLGLLPFNESVLVVVTASSIECLPPTPVVPINYTATLLIITSDCTNETACTTTLSLFDGNGTHGVGCLPHRKHPKFASGDEEREDEFEHEEEEDEPPATASMIVAFVLALIALFIIAVSLIILCVTFVRGLGRGAAPTSSSLPPGVLPPPLTQGGAGGVPTKTVVFSSKLPHATSARRKSHR